MGSLDKNDVRIFSGQSHPVLAAGIASHLNLPLDPTFFNRFSNDNLYVQLGASVRERKVYIVQSLIPPVSDNLMELMMMLDIARSAGASQIHAIIPFFSYARSDKKDAPRISITSRLVADLLVTAGMTHCMTMTLHSPQVHGFFSVPTDPLTARHLFIRYVQDRKYKPDETVIVSPDIGRAKPAGRFAFQLGFSLAAAQKERISDNEVVIGETLERQVSGFRRAVIYDDEIVTGTTVLELCKMLVYLGIEEILVICTHGLFAGSSLENLCRVPQITKIITTNTVPIPEARRDPKLEILSVAPIFAEAIWRNATRQSIGGLFTFHEESEENVLEQK
ncbi:MAG: ribose-phosphate pyrophosphokinase [Anaerolineales bacterium]|nr:ribose-phosphate pyrophosphokinase [Anaerolineales bacterium]